MAPFLPFFLSFFDPKVPHPSSPVVSSGAAGGGGGTSFTGGLTSVIPFFPFFASFLEEAAPQPPQLVSPVATGSDKDKSIMAGSGALIASSPVPFLPFFLSFLPTDIKPPQSSSSSALVSSTAGSSSFISFSPQSLKSNPDVVVFFLFFLLPPKDHTLDSAASPVVALVSLTAFSPDTSASTPSAILKSHLLPVFQLLPQPPNPKPEVLSLLSAPPKLRSSWGTDSSRRFISSNILVVGGSGAGGGPGGTGSACKRL